MTRNSGAARHRYSATAGQAPASTGITLAAIALFVGTGSSVAATLVQRHLLGNGSIDRTLLIALLLNIAIILFGWQRHRDWQRRILAEQSAEDRALALASNDLLTGLPGRRAFADEGAKRLTEAQRRRKDVALLIINLDNFRRINDLYGHEAGDALLMEIVERLKTAITAQSLIGRLGGDEFGCAIIYEGVHPGTVERAAQRLLDVIAEPMTVNGVTLRNSATIGIAGSDGGAASFDALLRCAGMALDAGKRDSRNDFVWFDQTMEQELRARNEMEMELRQAIIDQHIVPHFEPQIDLRTSALIGFEVLARWAHPKRGLIAPDLFLPVAEQSGLMADLATVVIRQAFQIARDWHPSIRLSINLSAGQLRDPWLAQKIVKLMTEHGFAAHRLEIEITETALFDNLPMAQSMVRSLKNQGVQIALDDFGTGYSSLAHLRALPFDRIKIDHSFVTSINDDPESAAIVTAVARLAESLNLPVAAEGITDKLTEQRMIALGCATGQGSLYGRADNAGAARRLLAERGLLVTATRGAPVADATDAVQRDVA